MTWRARLGSAACLAAVACGGCGGTPRPTAASHVVPWRAAASWSSSHLAQARLVEAPDPWSPPATQETERLEPLPVLRVSVARDASIRVEGGPTGVLPVSDREPAAFPAEVRAAILDWASKVRERSGNDPVLRVMIDRDAPASVFSSWLAHTGQDLAGFQAIDLAIELDPGPGEPRAPSELFLRNLGRSDEGARCGASVSLRRRQEAGSDKVEIELYEPLLERLFVFEPALALDDPAFLARANATWDDMARTLLTAIRLYGGPACLEIDPDVPFAYVPTLIQMIHAAGAGTVVLDGNRIDTLSRAWLVPERAPDGADDGSWIPWAAALAVAAFVATWLPMRRSRRPRPRAPDLSPPPV